jgi:glucose/arabinose dehydrogenase
MKFVKLFLTLVFFSSLTLAQGALPLTLRTQNVVSGLSLPVLARTAKDGTKRLFIVQQRGLIRVVQPGSNVATTFMDITSKVSNSGNERGLLGLTFHPNFATNSYFFVNYTRLSDGATIVARYTATNGNTIGDPNSERILLTIAQPFSNHNGGMVEFGPDGNLYIGMGDGGSSNDPNANAQNINVLLGKMLRITPDVSGNNTNPAYTNPTDNPYCCAAVTGADEIYTIGMRNPWRWSFDRQNGQLWAGDVGQDAVEEVDILNRGGNYGWRVYEGTSCTGNDSALCIPANYTMPVTQYAQSAARCAVTGGYDYRGTQKNLPNGTYIFADYCSGELFTWDGFSQVMRLDTPRTISSFGEDEDGEIYICGLATGTVDKIVRAKASADLDGDFKTDIGVYRPTTSDWFWLESNNSLNFRHYRFGATGDIPVPEDFDGDNVTDIGVFRPSNGTWYVVNSNNTVSIIPWGTNGDIPVQGDYDGDAKADFAVFRPSDGTWYIIQSTNSSFRFIPFGLNGDRPVQGDYDGDGKYDIAVYRGGNWYSLQSTNNAFVSLPFGLGTDKPVQGDFDGDGKTDRAVYRNGNWYQLLSSTNAFQAIPFGLTDDIPTVGDYDGDGRDDIAVFRPSNGTWYALRSTSGFLGLPFGTNGDIPIPANDVP